ncbi:MAG: MFS transporter [Henriciella sp.]|nr:MFS transporter [Henriciella sp.]
MQAQSATEPEGGVDASGGTSVSEFRAWITVGVLVIASLVSFVDRQILSLMVTPIKADLGLNDIQMGLLQGFAFAVFYAIAAVPLGWLADKASRKWIITVGVASWSAMTAVCGLAQNFVHLFLARMGVGVGEATLSASGHSMIADLFDRKRLPLAMSVYGMGVALGGGIAYIGGGLLVQWLNGLPPLAVGPFTFQPWQAVFITVGLPGILVAGLIGLVAKEPKRRAVSDPIKGMSLTRFAGDNVGLVTKLVLGLGMLTAAGYANLAWLPSFFERTFGWSTAQAGVTIGLLLLLVALPGGVLCGIVASRWADGGQRDAPVRFMAYASLATAPIAAIAFLLPNASWVVIALLIPMAFGSSYVGLGPAAVQAITPGELRGRTAAFQLLLTGLIGMVVGPLSVGLITNGLLQDEARINVALAIANPALTIVGGLLILWAFRSYNRALDSVPSEAPA